MTKKILLLGSGELGKEFTIAAQRLEQTVVACDAYAGAPAMQVADAAEVFDMLDGAALEAVVERHRPDIIVPEIEAIRTERLYDFERAGIQVVPSARAVNFTMNRKAIRDLAAKELGLRTARYFYARTLDELRDAAEQNRLSVRRQAADVLLGQGAVGRQKPRRRGARMALRMRGFAGRHTRADRRGVHPLRQRNHAAHRDATARPHLSARRSATCSRAATTARVSSPRGSLPSTCRKRSAWRQP